MCELVIRTMKWPVRFSDLYFNTVCRNKDFRLFLDVKLTKIVHNKYLNSSGHKYNRNGSYTGCPG